jgi:hypothetical protein
MNGLTSAAGRDAAWHPQPEPASVQLPEKVVSLIQPAEDVSSVLRQTQVQLSSTLTQISLSQPPSPWGRRMALIH